MGAYGGLGTCVGSPPSLCSIARGNEKCRPDEIRLKNVDGSQMTGPQRAPRDAVVLVLPGLLHIPFLAMCACMRLALSTCEVSHSQCEDNRWLCRVSIEIIAGGMTQANARDDGGAWEQWRCPCTACGQLPPYVSVFLS